MEINETLFIIPARGGSKGIPRKNIFFLLDKPMIFYTLDVARSVTLDENICVSTDDHEIIKLVENYGLKVPFVRPAELATDKSSSREVILHAIEFYENQLGKTYSKVCLLQPTSPLRTAKHIIEAFKLWNDELDMVVSVRETKSNPYFTLYEEGDNGYLTKSKSGNYTRRQDTPQVWEYNGAIFIININSLKNSNLSDLTKIIKYPMSKECSIDVDDIIDIQLVQIIMQKNLMNYDHFH